MNSLIKKYTTEICKKILKIENIQKLTINYSDNSFIEDLQNLRTIPYTDKNNLIKYFKEEFLDDPDSASESAVNSSSELESDSGSESDLGSESDSGTIAAALPAAAPKSALSVSSVSTPSLSVLAPVKSLEAEKIMEIDKQVKKFQNSISKVEIEIEADKVAVEAKKVAAEAAEAAVEAEKAAVKAASAEATEAVAVASKATDAVSGEIDAKIPALTLTTPFSEGNNKNKEAEIALEIKVVAEAVSEAAVALVEAIKEVNESIELVAVKVEKQQKKQHQ